jgi:hypothetical protein
VAALESATMPIQVQVVLIAESAVFSVTIT